MDLEARFYSMNKRELISGAVFFLALFDVWGLTGSAELGELSFGEYVPAAIAHLVIMGAALLFGGMEFPQKKKTRRH